MKASNAAIPVVGALMLPSPREARAGFAEWMGRGSRRIVAVGEGTRGSPAPAGSVDAGTRGPGLERG